MPSLVAGIAGTAEDDVGELVAVLTAPAVVIVELVGDRARAVLVDIVTRLDPVRDVVVPPVDKIEVAAKAPPTVKVLIIAKSATDL